MLRWIGNEKGLEFVQVEIDNYVAIPPARDLTDDEVEGFGGEERLLATGAYALARETKAIKGGSQNKSVPPAPDEDVTPIIPTT